MQNKSNCRSYALPLYMLCWVLVLSSGRVSAQDLVVVAQEARLIEVEKEEAVEEELVAGWVQGGDDEQDSEHFDRSFRDQLMLGLQRTAVLNDDQIAQLDSMVAEEMMDEAVVAQCLLGVFESQRDELDLLSDTELAACRRLCQYYSSRRDPAVKEEAAVPEAVFEEEMLLGGDMNDPATSLLLVHAKVVGGLARRACDLSDAQIAELKNIDADWIQRQSKGKGKVNRGIAAGIARFLGGGVVEVNAPEQPENIIRLVRPKILEEVREILTEDQREVFDREWEARDAFQNEAVAAVLVTTLDRRLFIKKEQREGLTQDVTKWLKGRNRVYWQFYFQNGMYIPDIPRSVLAKHLGDEQNKSLEGVNRYTYDADQMEWQMAENMQEFFDE